LPFCLMFLHWDLPIWVFFFGSSFLFTGPL
jgi:hypothetical protein